MSFSLLIIALGITIILLSKSRSTVCLKVISATVPINESVTLIISPILKGLKVMIKTPPTIFAKASWEATATIKAITPAPPKAVCATPFKEGKARRAIKTPTV